MHIIPDDEAITRLEELDAILRAANAGIDRLTSTAADPSLLREPGGGDHDPQPPGVRLAWFGFHLLEPTALVIVLFFALVGLAAVLSPAYLTGR